MEGGDYSRACKAVCIISVFYSTLIYVFGLGFLFCFGWLQWDVALLVKTVKLLVSYGIYLQCSILKAFCIFSVRSVNGVETVRNTFISFSQYVHVSDCGDNPQPPILLLRLSLLYSVYAPTSDFSFTLNITAKRLNLPSWAGITL